MNNQPTESRQPRLSEQVEILEAKCSALESLCGEMISCLRANILRGSITSDNNDVLEDVINSWSDRIRKA